MPKYNIYKKLKALNKADYDSKIRALKSAWGVSDNSFYAKLNETVSEKTGLAALPTALELEKAAKILNCTIDDLIETPENISTEEINLNLKK